MICKYKGVNIKGFRFEVSHAFSSTHFFRQFDFSSGPGIAYKILEMSLEVAKHLLILKVDL